MGNGEGLETPGNGADDVEDTDVTDMDVNILGLILEEVRKVRKAQDDQGDELEHIKDELKEVRESQVEQVEELGVVKERVNIMSSTLDAVFASHVVHGKELGEIKQHCCQRFEQCSKNIRALQEEAPTGVSGVVKKGGR